MSIIDWAFEQKIPTAEKLVLVYLATQANSVGVGAMDRPALEAATDYQKRSMQRLIKSLKDAGLYRDLDNWYCIGDSKIDTDVPPLPENVPPAANVDAETLANAGEVIAKVMIDSADYQMDQLANFEIRLDNKLTSFIATAKMISEYALHVEHSPRTEPKPVDPVLENPLYQTLLDAQVPENRAYDLSAADLNLDEELEPVPAALAPAADDYTDNEPGRFTRILDILHGAAADQFDNEPLRYLWRSLETMENKASVDGETSAFKLVYPAIVEAAKANVGKMDIRDFISQGLVTNELAPWDVELNAPDKEDPAMNIEIARMLQELSEANDPRCDVGPRTTEEGEDGQTRTETLLGFHRRVTAKYNQMIRLKNMGVM